MPAELDWRVQPSGGVGSDSSDSAPLRTADALIGSPLLPEAPVPLSGGGLVVAMDIQLKDICRISLPGDVPVRNKG
jgi:hypothetical protein